jgi:MFS superfamily sulfate permease-like transporter
MPRFLKDIPASLVVFLIALPLSMGIAIASGVPPVLGLVTAVIGGVVVGAFGGAHLQISGPSAGLTVLVLAMVAEHGLGTFGVIVIFAGLLQVVAGTLKLGRYFQAVSPAVVRGMLAGIGTLIIASQFHVMIDDNIHASGLANILAIPAGVMKAVAGLGDRNHSLAAAIGVGTLAAILAWEKWKPARLKVVPGPLVGVVLAAGLAAIFDMPILYVALPENVLGMFSLPDVAALSQITTPAVLTDALALAFVASAETLLCATAVSRMHSGPATNYNRELAIQGVANVLCGGVGSLPLTGVISRSTANVQAGAGTRLSAVFHAVWIALFVLLVPGLLALVPMSSLAAILIYVGVKLIDPASIRTIAGYGRPVLAIFVATVAGVVFIDLLSGIVLGLVLSGAKLMYRMSHVEFDVRDQGDRFELHMFGAATFLALPALSTALAEVPKGKELHIFFDDLTFIDHACIDLLNVFEGRYSATGGEVIVEWDGLMDRYKNSGRPITEEVPKRSQAS